MKAFVLTLIILLVIVTGALTWQIRGSDAMGIEIKDTVRSEAKGITKEVGERCDELEKRLDRIEGKIDKLIEMLTPRLPDGMKSAS
jgi:TolA-binding protein